MRATLVTQLRTQYLGLIALVLVVVGGSAYAAGLAKNSVKSKQIKNGQVKSVDVKDQNLTGTDIADGTVGAAEITDGGVGSLEIADAAVTATEIANDAVIGQKIATGVIGGGKLSPGAVSTNKLEDGAVDSAKIADGSIGAADLDPGSVGSIASKTGALTMGTGEQNVLTVSGFGTFSLDCPAADSFEVGYSRDPAIPQTMAIYGHDTDDNAPADTAEGTGGGVGFSGAGNIEALDGYVWAFVGDRALRIDYLARPRGATECSYYLRTTISPNTP